jgi:hypothetical protein
MQLCLTFCNPTRSGISGNTDSSFFLIRDHSSFCTEGYRRAFGSPESFNPCFRAHVLVKRPSEICLSTRHRSASRVLDRDIASARRAVTCYTEALTPHHMKASGVILYHLLYIKSELAYHTLQSPVYHFTRLANQKHLAKA